MDLSTFFNLLQLIGGIILSIGYIPQIATTIKKKTVGDFNPMYYRLVFTGILLMEAYAINLVVTAGAGWMFLITNTASTILSGTMFVLIEIYRTKK